MTLYHVAGDREREFAAAMNGLKILDEQAELDTLERKMGILTTIAQTALDESDHEAAQAFIVKALKLDPANPRALALGQRLELLRERGSS
jgi:uncharacterized protein HemY